MQGLRLEGKTSINSPSDEWLAVSFEYFLLQMFNIFFFSKGTRQRIGGGDVFIWILASLVRSRHGHRGPADPEQLHVEHPSPEEEEREHNWVTVLAEAWQ